MHAHVAYMQTAGLSTGEWAQVAAAAFTALTALAAFASVARVERDRWRERIPEFHFEVLGDGVNNDMRMTVANVGGPAREVRLMGTLGDYGWATPTPSTAYWRSGESRRYRLSMPLIRDVEARAFVEARDIRLRRLIVATSVGASYRWRRYPWSRHSGANTWRRLFKENPGPLDVPNTPVAVELLERDV